MSEHLEMWQELGLDIDRHNELLGVLGEFYGPLYLEQENRPKGMEYFDFVISEVHGLRVKELQEHKKNGGIVVGTFCVYVPEELILAVDGVCVGLCAGTDFPSSDAETILPRNLCPLIKSAVGFKKAKLCPYFESVDLVVGETTCDGKKKAWEIFADDVPMYVMEVPQKTSNRKQGLWLKEVKEFATKLEELSGKKITLDALKKGVELVNAKRNALKRLFDLRKNPVVPISGKDVLLISQIAFYDNVERFTQKVNELCDELEQRIKDNVSVANGAKRIVISGTPMAIPNWKLHHILETNNATVVCEESCVGTRYFSNLTDNDAAEVEELIANIADRHIKTPCACFTPNTERIDNVIEYAKQYKADGVIDYTLAFCHCYNVENHLLAKSLGDAGIPNMQIETDYSMGDMGQLTTRVQAFLETLS